MKLSEVANFTGRLTVDQDDNVYCAFFAMCENPATTTVPNPILGDVPACQRCADRAAELSA